MVHRWQIFGDFLCHVFSASRVQHIEDLHPKFAHYGHMCGSMVGIQSAMAGNSRGKKKERRKKRKPQDENIMACSIP